ncbi:MAG: vWA domain-containing protein [Acidobacteriota bacterium]
MWQGVWVDLLSRGSPYAEAREYFTGQRQAYGEALRAARAAGGRVTTPPTPTPAPPGAGLDLIFCIDTTGSMSDDIDAAKAASTALIEAIFAKVTDPRIALVAYRDYGDEYVTRGFAFTSNKDEIRGSILGLRVAGGGDEPEAVYDALLYALDCTELGGWRSGVKKVIVVIGDAPPHSKRHTLEEVVRKAEEVDPAHIFAIAVAGSSGPTREAFGALAERTGGVVLRTAEAGELPEKMVEVAALGAEYADRATAAATIERVQGGYAWLWAEGLVVGQEVLFLDPAEGRTAIGRGLVTAVAGAEATVEVQELWGAAVLTERCGMMFPAP